MIQFYAKYFIFMRLKISCLFLVLILSFFVGIKSEDIYRKVIHNTDPQAKCLDGSPALLYIHEGSETDKFLLYFYGYGFCGENTLAKTLQSCYQRSKTQYGSSALWPETMSGDQLPGIVSLAESVENVYQNWTKVILATCQGSIHQGNSLNPIQYKDTKLYFRANTIVRSHFKWLIEKYKMDSASKIIVSGGSAGAAGTLVWGNYLQTVVKNPSIVYNIPDCGIYLNTNTYQTNFPQLQSRLINIMSLAFRDQQSPLEQCNKQYPGEEWRCVLLEYNNPFLKGKMLFVNSQYDSWGIQNVLQMSCLKSPQNGERYTLKYCSSQQIAFLEVYRNKYLDLLNNKVRSPERGVWSIACSRHCYLTSSESYNAKNTTIQRVNSMTINEAVYEFVIENKINWTIDLAPWPTNAPCAY